MNELKFIKSKTGERINPDDILRYGTIVKDTSYSNTREYIIEYEGTYCFLRKIKGEWTDAIEL